jgi:hypothetical protein
LRNVLYLKKGFEFGHPKSDIGVYGWIERHLLTILQNKLPEERMIVIASVGGLKAGIRPDADV